jgi:hypothetical protein
LVNVNCNGAFCRGAIFSITVTDTNDQQSSFGFRSSGSQLGTLSPGNFVITESSSQPLLSATFSGDCMGCLTTPNHAQATGTIPGQHLTCTIENRLYLFIPPNNLG